MKNIYVGNLSFSATEEMLRSLFEKYGAVDRVHIVTDRDTGRSRGFGFVTFARDEDAKTAISKMHGTNLDGRTITVNQAQEKSSPKGGPRGGRNY